MHGSQAISTNSLAIVVPLYKSAGSLDAVTARLNELAIAIAPRSLSVVFVDDGSPDACAQHLLDDHHPPTFSAKLVRLTRNFGAFAAIREGLRHCDADFVSVLAADLQEPPELIPALVAAMENDDLQLAVGRRTERTGDPALSRALSKTYWRLYRRYVQPAMPESGIDIFACRRHVVDELLELSESNTSLVGCLIWLGYPFAQVDYARRERADGGTSAWSLRKRIRYMSDSAFAFSRLPITLIGTLGGFGFLGCMLAGIAILFGRVLGEIQTPGYTPIMLAIFFCTSLILLSLWMVGEVGWRAFENTRRRPQSVVNSVHELNRLPQVKLNLIANSNATGNV